MESDKSEDYVTQRLQSEKNHDYDIDDLDYLWRHEGTEADVEERRDEALRVGGTLSWWEWHPALPWVSGSLSGRGTVRLGLSISLISHCLVPFSKNARLAPLPRPLGTTSNARALPGS